jgi:type IV secretory pathway VirD2 relaxase
VAIREQVGRDPHRRPGREDVVASGHVLLQHVVLHRAAEPLGSDALLLGDKLVQQEEHRRGGVDRHRRRHRAERDAVENELHVGERVDRHARATDLADGARVV